MEGKAPMASGLEHSCAKAADLAPRACQVVSTGKPAFRDSVALAEQSLLMHVLSVGSHQQHIAHTLLTNLPSEKMTSLISDRGMRGSLLARSSATVRQVCCQEASRRTSSSRAWSTLVAACGCLKCLVWRWACAADIWACSKPACSRFVAASAPLMCKVCWHVRQHTWAC